MTSRHVSGVRTAAVARPSARGALIAWAGFIAASATILAVAFG